MKIIHTSDWHIGRKFERESLAADQQAFLTWLASYCLQNSVDLVIISGDIYDRSMPSEEAIDILDDGLDALRLAGAEVVMISGNHDSATRLAFGSRRQAAGGVHVFAEPQNFPAFWNFRKEEEAVAILGIPFRDPLSVAAPESREEGVFRSRTHENVLIDALNYGRESLDKGSQIPSIVVAHAFVKGASTSDSEKQLSIGGSEVVDASIFDGFDYVALGHLHRPQLIDERENFAYSGSPLPYSFSEDHLKSIRVIDIKEGRIEKIEEVAIPIGRPVITITDTLENLLTKQNYNDYLDHWVAVRLTDEVPRVQPMERLRIRFPYVVSVRSDRATQSMASILRNQVDPTKTRDTQEVVSEFLKQIRGRESSPEEEIIVTNAITSATKMGNS